MAEAIQDDTLGDVVWAVTLRVRLHPPNSDPGLTSLIALI